MGESGPVITVIIPARNAAATLSQALAALEQQSRSDLFQVIVVDDGSTDATAAVARRSPVVNQVLGLGVRAAGAGPAQARNAGASAARTRLLVFLDADCRPTQGWLRAGLQALAQADLVVGAVRPEPGAPLTPYSRTLWVTGLSPLHESANLFVRRELFDSLGGFDSWLGPRAGKELGEDALFGWRARRAGARISASSNALVHHAVFPRGPLGYIAERARLRFFPALAREIPELRTEFFYRRVFLSARSASFHRALTAALGLTLVRRARTPAGGALAVLLSAPYGRALHSDFAQGRRTAGAAEAGAQLVAARLSADALGAGALLLGSIRARSLLL